MKKTVKVRSKPMSVCAVNHHYDSTYETDFYAWTKQQADLLKNRDFAHIDIENLIEEIESLGRSERDKLTSHLRNYLLHKLKYEFQPSKRSHSWVYSLRNAREESLDTLNENPSLKPQVDELIKKAYKYARNDAIIETGLDEKAFPKKCPWTFDEIMKGD